MKVCLKFSSYLSFEFLSFFGRIILGISSDISTTDVLDRDVFNVEADVVSGLRHLQSRVMHLNRLHLSGHVHRGKRHNHTRLHRSSLHTADRNSSNT